MESKNGVYASMRNIESRNDFVRFLRELLEHQQRHPQAWPHQSLQAFLDAMADWTEDMDGYFQNRRETVPEQPSWKILAEMLLAARVYE